MHVACLYPVLVSGQKAKAFQRDVNALLVAHKSHVVGHYLTDGRFKHLLADTVLLLFQRSEYPLAFGGNFLFQS